jgi:hypothetical protein
VESIREVPLKRQIYWFTLFLAGSLTGVFVLIGLGGANMVTTVCGKPYVLKVRYASPFTTPTEYSDPNVNNEDCFASQDTADAVMDGPDP